MKTTKKLTYLFTVLFAVLICIYVSVIGVKADTTWDGIPVRESLYSTAADGAVFLGMEVTFYGDEQAALDKINEIRYEACKNGYPDPRNRSRKLTLSDYVPIKWSSELAAVAKIRACESGISSAHSRLNGWGWSSVGDIYPSGEVLAWGVGSLTGGVNLWYSEKKHGLMAKKE